MRLLGRPARRAIHHRLPLARSLGDGRWPVDHRLVERRSRRSIVGRRSYRFAGTRLAGELAAVACSLLCAHHLAGIDPMELLARVLPRLARGDSARHAPSALVPTTWSAAREVGAPRRGARHAVLTAFHDRAVIGRSYVGTLRPGSAKQCSARSACWAHPGCDATLGVRERRSEWCASGWSWVFWSA